MPQSPISTPQSEIQKRPRGGQSGNHNALKHGFYTSKFATSELKSLPDDFKGLNDEITMLRLVIRRQVEHTIAAPTAYDFNEALRLLCMASLTLNRLVRTSLLLSANGNDEFSQTLTAAINQLSVEWDLDNTEPRHLDLPFRAPRLPDQPAQPAQPSPLPPNA